MPEGCVAWVSYPGHDHLYHCVLELYSLAEEPSWDSYDDAYYYERGDSFHDDHLLDRIYQRVRRQHE